MSLQQATSEYALVPLKMVGILATLNFVSSCIFEIFSLHNLYQAQLFLIGGLQIVFSAWALIEVWLLQQRKIHIPLKKIELILIVQLGVVFVRHLPWLTDEYLQFESPFFNEPPVVILITLFLVAFMVIFFTISKLLIDAFSYSARSQARDLSIQMKIAKRALADLRVAKQKVDETADELAKVNNELNRMATTDFLTGISNRRSLEKAALLELERMHRYATPCSVLMLDLDHFKSVNDTYGHEVGDLVLVGLTRCVQKELRQIDIFARWGGEEFVILLPHKDIQQAQHIAEKLREKIAGWIFPAVAHVTASFGVAQFQPNDTLDTALKRADQALYNAKQSGRNKVCLESLDD